MKTILLIEDDPFLSRMYTKIFSLHDFKIEAAADGEEGLAAAKRLKPDAILLDIMMPKLNGMEVLEGLKKDDTTKDIPVIMLTNLSDQQQRDAALAAGALRYLVKSEFDPDETVDVVKETLSK